MIKFFVVKKLKLRKPASGKRQDVAKAAVARCDGAVSGRGGTQTVTRSMAKAPRGKKPQKAGGRNGEANKTTKPKKPKRSELERVSKNAESQPKRIRTKTLKPNGSLKEDVESTNNRP